MDAKLVVNSERNSTLEPEVKAAWNAPNISRLDMQLTMYTSGSMADAEQPGTDYT